MNKLLLFFFLVFFIGCSRSINQHKSKLNIEQNLVFPLDWLGVWTGDLKINNGYDKNQLIPMELHLLATSDNSIYTFKIIYSIDDKRDSREYLLVEKDKAKGQYLIDEKNSIGIDAFLIDNHLLQSFEVMSNSILSDIYLDGDHLHYEIIFSTKNNPKISGGQLYEGDSIPEVISYPVVSTQKAVLSRVN